VKVARDFCRRGSCLPGRTPMQPGETREITIGGHPLTPSFDRERSQPGILHQVAGGRCRSAERLENAPVAFSRNNHRGVRLLKQHFAECEDLRCRARAREDLWMRRYPNHRGKHLRCNTVCLLRIDGFFKPVPVARVLRGVAAKRIHKHVDIRQDQPRPSMRSSKAAESLRSTPGSGPPPRLHIGKRTRRRSLTFAGFAISRCNPCSMRAVNVMPRFAASRLARSRRASESRIVVRICLSIS
jgi:hypothetical protein